ADGRRSAALRRPAPCWRRGGPAVQAARAPALTAFPAWEAGLSWPVPRAPRSRHGRGRPLCPPVARCFGRCLLRTPRYDGNLRRCGGPPRAEDFRLRAQVDVTQLFSLRENAIAKEPGIELS